MVRCARCMKKNWIKQFIDLWSVKYGQLTKRHAFIFLGSSLFANLLVVAACKIRCNILPSVTQRTDSLLYDQRTDLGRSVIHPAVLQQLSLLQKLLQIDRSNFIEVSVDSTQRFNKQTVRTISCRTLTARFCSTNKHSGFAASCISKTGGQGRSQPMLDPPKAYLSPAPESSNTIAGECLENIFTRDMLFY